MSLVAFFTVRETLEKISIFLAFLFVFLSQLAKGKRPWQEPPLPQAWQISRTLSKAQKSIHTCIDEIDTAVFIKYTEKDLQTPTDFGLFVGVV